MQSRLLFFLFLLLPSLPFFAQKRHYVRADAPAGGDGRAWTSAYRDLQTALGVMAAGDTLWIAGGTYKPTAGGDRSISFEPRSGTRLFGGFGGFETALWQRDPARWPTVLSGDIGAASDISDNSYNVVYLHEPDSNTVLDGLVFCCGNADYAGTTSSARDRRKCGGGLYVMGADADAYPELRNCVFQDNTARSAGGGAVVNGEGDGSVAPRFVGCRFERNRAAAGDGGGLAKIGGSWVDRGVDLDSCIFADNYAQKRGGAFFYLDSERTDSLSIDGCRFERNGAEDGAVLFLWMGRAAVPGKSSISRSVFQENTIAQGAIVRFFPLRENLTRGIAVTDCVFRANKIHSSAASVLTPTILFVDQLGDQSAQGNIERCLFEGNTGGRDMLSYDWLYSYLKISYMLVANNTGMINGFSISIRSKSWGKI